VSVSLITVLILLAIIVIVCLAVYQLSRSYRTIHKILYKITAQLPCRLIDVNGSPYMERYAMPKFLRTALKRLGFTAYLHRFVSSDSERNVHDHPWPWAIAFVLTGRYIEQRVTGLDIENGWISKLQTIRWFNRLGSLDFHCITKPQPNTWTLFIHGPRTKSWGFLEAIDTGTVYHQPYDVAATLDWESNSQTGQHTCRQPRELSATQCNVNRVNPIVLSDAFIDNLFQGTNFGAEINGCVNKKRDFIASILRKQTGGHWSGQTAYALVINAGFVTDAPARQHKKLTALGAAYMDEYVRGTGDSPAPANFEK